MLLNKSLAHSLTRILGDKAHSGFPEISYGKFAAQLVAKGYRVARVEQTETPEMLKERNDSKGKGTKDKVVKREMCSIMSKASNHSQFSLFSDLFVLSCTGNSHILSFG